MSSAHSTLSRVITHVDVSVLKSATRHARTHSHKQIKQIALSIERFGFTNPILIGNDNEIIAGRGRLEAAKLLGLPEVPTILLANLSSAERRAYVLADNKLALNAGWDQEILAIELQGLVDLGFDIELSGFSVVEIDEIILSTQDADPKKEERAEDQIPGRTDNPVTRRGDLWILGRHRLLCGDAREPDNYTSLMANELAQLVFTDPPYNVAIHGHVSGLGKTRHREFPMASGEMSESEFRIFLNASLGSTASVMKDGAIAFVCMDWRHIGDLIAVGSSLFEELKNLVVWNKTNGGMGSFYRSKHELICVFKKGKAAHVNTFGLGDGGRYRTNVWDYPGISALGARRAAELAMHPTVKPVALVADAIRDCSKRGHIVLDPFGGSGTTLIAAEKTGRTARLIEYDPLYCDTIVRRWQAFTGKQARREIDNATFEDQLALSAEQG